VSGKSPTAVIAAAKDTGKARDALGRMRDKGAQHHSFKGVGYDVEPGGDANAIVGDFAVGGDVQAVRAVIAASKGTSLADAQRFQAARDRATSQRLGFAYIDTPGLLARASNATGLGSQGRTVFEALLGGAAREPAVITLQAVPDAFHLDFVGHGANPLGILGSLIGQSTPLVGEVPGDSWLALGLPHLDQLAQRVLASVDALGIPGLSASTIKQLVRRQTGFDLDRDLFSWLGDAAIFVRGTSRAQLGGGVLLSSRDPAASRRAVTRIGRLLARRAGTRVTGAGANLTIRMSGLGQPLRLIARGNRVIATYGAAAARAALSGGATLAQGPALAEAKRALGAGMTASGVVLVPPILQLADSLGAGSSSGYQAARRYLATLAVVAFGSGRSGDRVITRVAVGLRRP
jgi:hypothetical protein